MRGTKCPLRSTTSPRPTTTRRRQCSFDTEFWERENSLRCGNAMKSVCSGSVVQRDNAHTCTHPPPAISAPSRYSLAFPRLTFSPIESFPSPKNRKKCGATPRPSRGHQTRDHTLDLKLGTRRGWRFMRTCHPHCEIAKLCEWAHHITYTSHST